MEADYLGSKATYNVFALGVPSALAVPLLAHHAAEGGLPTLYAFGGVTLLSVSFYGGLLSCLPPYIGRTFGPQHVGAIRPSQRTQTLVVRLSLLNDQRSTPCGGRRAHPRRLVGRGDARPAGEPRPPADSARPT